MDLDEAKKLLGSIETEFHQVPHFYHRVHQRYGMPSVWTRYWLPVSGGALMTIWLSRSIWRSRRAMLHLCRDLAETSMQFLQNWIVEPCRQIWKTIRHEDTLQLTAGTASLSSDLEVCTA